MIKEVEFTHDLLLPDRKLVNLNHLLNFNSIITKNKRLMSAHFIVKLIFPFVIPKLFLKNFDFINRYRRGLETYP